MELVIARDGREPVHDTSHAAGLMQRRTETLRRSTLAMLTFLAALLFASSVAAQYGSCVPIRSAAQVIQRLKRAGAERFIFFCVEGPPDTCVLSPVSGILCCTDCAGRPCACASYPVCGPVWRLAADNAKTGCTSLVQTELW